MLALQGEAAWAEEKFLGHRRQSVPRNGRVHLHIIELGGGEGPLSCELHARIASADRPAKMLASDSPPVRESTHHSKTIMTTTTINNLLMPLLLMGCFPVDFQEAKRPLRTKSVKRPLHVGKRPIYEGKRPIKAVVLVGVAVSCLMGCFRAPPPWRKRPL